MSVFPTGRPTNGQRPAFVRSDSGQADGALVQRIKGQIYLIQEDDLETLWNGRTRSPLSGLVSRH